MPLAFIGLGANLAGPAGPPESTLCRAVQRLQESGRVTCRSSLYSTEPVGLADQPRFVNAVIALETALSPRDLLDALLAVEREFGRDRSASVPNGPRSLDLDLLLYGDFVLGDTGLEVPHPRIAERAFVLVPLHDIAPNLRDPRSNATVSELVKTLRNAAPQSIDHAVVQISSDSWHPGGCDPAAAAASARAAADPDHS
jgi:2-amino-4-hydroxy-6-hydroxymethyldihydropteridine diphosphokinase